MKKAAFLTLIVMFLGISFAFWEKDDSFEVLKVNSASDFYVDLNKNKICDDDELVSLYNLKFFETALSDSDNARLSYLSDAYAEKILLNKKLKIRTDNDSTRHFILSDGSDYESNLIKYGYVFSENNRESVKKNLDYARTLDLVSYNSHSRKFHNLNCKYAFSSINSKILKASQLPKDSKPCKNCHLNNSQKTMQSQETKYPRDVYENYSPIYRDAFLEFYVTDFTKYFYPSAKCLTTACKSLLYQINSAKASIDFAIYGVDNQPEIVKALLNAQNRGVRVRWVYDVDKNGSTIYQESLKLKNSLTSARSDIEISGDCKDSIMHNKFFIFDSKTVWSGSANISHTDLSGFNANSVVLIKSPAIAKIYEKEFEQMFSGKFHKLKDKTESNFNRLGASEIEVFFSPQDDAIKNRLVPLVDNAKKYIYVPVFVITHKDFNESLVKAKARGVDVKIIVDATSASNKYSSVKELREKGLAVKTENRAGKMHMKSMIVDDEYVVVGSMNFSKSGEKYNDENVIFIKNHSLAKAFKDKFLFFWKEIPDKWLLKNPGAESWNSINSCFDGIDNDFDSKIDMQDEGCNYKKTK